MNDGRRWGPFLMALGALTPLPAGVGYAYGQHNPLWREASLVGGIVILLAGVLLFFGGAWCFRRALEGRSQCALGGSLVVFYLFVKVGSLTQSVRDPGIQAGLLALAGLLLALSVVGFLMFLHELGRDRGDAKTARRVVVAGGMLSAGLLAGAGALYLKNELGLAAGALLFILAYARFVQVLISLATSHQSQPAVFDDF